MTNTTQEQDHALGLKIVRQFFDASRLNYPFAVSYSFDEMLKTLEGRLGGKTFLATLGLAAHFADMDSSETYSAMYALARKAGGKIPEKNGDFKNFMIDQATSVNFTDAVIYTATETGKTVIKGFEEVGNSVLLTGKIVNFLLPVIVLYFGYMYLNKKVLK